MDKLKIIRACTVPQSLGFVSGMVSDLSKKYEVVLLSSPGEYWEVIENVCKNAKFIKVPIERHISLGKDLRALVRLWRVFRKERPQMVHSMTPKAGLLCMLAAKFARIPVRVHTFTGLVFPTATGLKRKILIFTDKLTCACATHIIPEGQGVKKDLQKYITKKSMKVLGYGSCKGIDLEYFDRTDEVLKLADELRNDKYVTFVTIGRLVGDKGINELVNAFVRLNKEFPDTRLILVGHEEKDLDPLLETTQKLMAEVGSIYAVGWKSDVRTWLVASDVAVLSSYREGFPNMVIEAGAMGLPQIVTDINGANEIIQNYVNGIVVPPKNENALYEAMKQMMDKGCRQSLAVKAREMIASRYDQNYVRKCLYDFYDEIL